MVDGDGYLGLVNGHHTLRLMSKDIVRIGPNF